MTDYDLTRDNLRATRDAHGAESAIGHHCSNLLEMLENMTKATDRDQKKRLAANIETATLDLAKLLAARH